MDRSSQKSSIATGTYELFIGNLVSTFLAAVTSIFVGRLLGPQNFGLYTIALIIPTYAYVLLRWGLSSTITRYAAKYLSEGNESKAISFSYTISILHIAAGLIAVALLIPVSSVVSSYLLHRPELSSGILIPVALVSVVGQIMFNNGSAAFVGLHEFRKSAVFQTTMGFTKLVVSVLLLLIGYSVLGAVAGYTVGFLGAGIISFLFLASANKSVIPKDIRDDVRTCIKYAPPIWLSQVLVSIIPPFQSTILAFAVSNEEIGWYSAAVNIATLITLFTFPVATSLLPLFSKTNGGRKSDLVNTYRLSVKYSALIVTPASMFVMALSTPLVTAVYGNAYRFAGDYLLTLAIVNLLVGIGNISWSTFLYGVGETRRALFATAAGSAVSMAISLILAYYVGVYGIIIGTIAGNVISLVLGSRFASGVLDARLQTWVNWRIYLASALSAIAIYPLSLLRFNPVLIVVVGGALFLMVLIPIMALTKALTKEDIIELRKQFEKSKLMNNLLALIARYFGIFVR